jgi:hypothetical protein
MGIKTKTRNSDGYGGSYFIQTPGQAGQISFEDIINVEQSSNRQINSTIPLDTIIVPTYINLEKISGGLFNLLNNFLLQKGIKTEPTIEISINAEKNEVDVSGERKDIKEINNLINSNDDIKEKIITVNAIASHVCQMPEHLAFQKEYFESENPGQVLEKYSHLFNDNKPEPELSLRFTSEKLDIYYNGSLWNYK